MRFLIDVCVPLPTRQCLRQAGHELVMVEELGRSRAPNGDLLHLAAQQRVVLLTLDRGIGYVTTYPLGTHHGIIVLKIPKLPDDVETAHRRLLEALRTIPPEHLSGRLLIVDRNKSRLRRPA